MKTTRDFGELPTPLLEAWRGDVAEPAEVRRAYLKFSWRRRSAPLPRIGRWAIALGLSSAGIAFAAVGVQRAQEALFHSSPAATPSTASPAPRTKRPARRVATPRVLEKDAPPAPAPRDEKETAAEGAPSAHDGLPSAPAVPPERPKAARVTANAKTAARAAEPAESVSVQRESAWEQAARGLRERNPAATEQALAELENQASVSDRDAARLIRAQMLMAAGRTAEARSILESLTATANAGSVKSKSSALLAELEARNQAERAARASGSKGP